jgi:F-type H+-transporting ATPase subunit epsilon
MAEEHKLHARVLTPEGEVFDGELEQLSTKTQTGEIGILARHVPVLARLVPSELRLHKSEGDVERYATAEGWLQVFANRATVLVSEAVPPDELDAGELRDRVSEAEDRLNEAEEGSAAADQAEREKLRAEAFLEIAEGGS